MAPAPPRTNLSRRPRAAFAALFAVSVASSLGCSKPGPDQTTESSKEVREIRKEHATKGVIKSFGPEKKLANIAHEDIPNYMSAMTMSFEAASPTQLEGLAVGERVAFTFFADGAKHVLVSIRKEP